MLQARRPQPLAMAAPCFLVPASATGPYAGTVLSKRVCPVARPVHRPRATPRRRAMATATLDLDPAELVRKEYVYLASQPVGDTGAAAVAAALRTPGNRIMGVNMDSCGVTCAGAAALADAARENVVLEELVLADNEVGDAGATALAQALAGGASALRVLSLVRNRIGAAGGAALGRALEANTALEVIYLMGMNGKKGGGMGDAGAEGWVEGIAGNRGKFWFVNLSGNDVSPTMLEKLRAARVEGKHTVFPADPHPGYS